MYGKEILDVVYPWTETFYGKITIMIYLKED